MIKISFICFFFNMATRELKITQVARVVFLLDSRQDSPTHSHVTDSWFCSLHMRVNENLSSHGKKHTHLDARK